MTWKSHVFSQDFSQDSIQKVGCETSTNMHGDQIFGQCRYSIERALASRKVNIFFSLSPSYLSLFWYLNPQFSVRFGQPLFLFFISGKKFTQNLKTAKNSLHFTADHDISPYRQVIRFETKRVEIPRFKYQTFFQIRSSERVSFVAQKLCLSVNYLL